MAERTFWTQFLLQKLLRLIKSFFIAIGVINQAAKHGLDSGLSKQRLFSILETLNMRDESSCINQISLPGHQ